MEISGSILHYKNNKQEQKEKRQAQAISSKISTLSQKKLEAYLDKGLNCTIPFEISDGIDNKSTSLLHQFAFLNAKDPIKKIVREHLTKVKPICIDVKDSFGNTPLMLACLKENFEATLLLLLARGDPNLKNDAGLSSFDIALESKSPLLPRLLLSTGVTPSEKTAQKFQEKNILFKSLDNSTIKGILTFIKADEGTNIHDLPPEILSHLFSFLSEDIFSILSISKEWNGHARHDSLLKNLIRYYPYIQLPEPFGMLVYDWIKNEFDRLKKSPCFQKLKDGDEFKRYGSTLSLPLLNALKKWEIETEIQEIYTRCKDIPGFRAFQTEVEESKQNKIALLKQLRGWEHRYNLEILCQFPWLKLRNTFLWNKDEEYLSKESSEKLKFLQEKIKEASELTDLDLRHCDLTKLPPEIGQFAKLKSLNLEGNKLTNLPSEIGKLTNLKNIYLHENQLTCLPPDIEQLSGLEVLNLHDNQLKSLPPEIGKLSNLQAIDLSNNQLTCLPAEIGGLSNLSQLSLHCNQLTSLPPEIGKLSKLKELHLPGNRLKTLPSEIGQLIELRDLKSRENQLNCLPHEIGYLSGLLRLYLEKNQLNSIPSEIYHLPKLYQLDLERKPA